MRLWIPGYRGQGEGRSCRHRNRQAQRCKKGNDLRWQRLTHFLHDLDPVGGDTWSQAGELFRVRLKKHTRKIAGHFSPGYFMDSRFSFTDTAGLPLSKQFVTQTLIVHISVVKNPVIFGPTGATKTPDSRSR